MQEIVHEYSSIALDYQDEITKWSDPDHYDANVLRIQLPYVAPATTPGLTAEQQKERKRELARRLMEMNARKREERVTNKKLANILYFILTKFNMKNKFLTAS